MLEKIKASPHLARAVPFVIFGLLSVVQGWFGDNTQYYIYALKTVIGIWILLLVRSSVPEMRWDLSWSGVIVGAGIFWAWVGLDGHYPKIFTEAEGFNPNRSYGVHSVLANTFIGVRLIGSSLVVPPLEEVFYRSYLYRFIRSSSFMEIPLKGFEWKSFLLTAVVFGLGHYEWLPGILCAFAYQALVCWKGRLGDAVTAHTITNFLLGLWILSYNAWHFW